MNRVWKQAMLAAIVCVSPFVIDVGVVADEESSVSFAARLDLGFRVIFSASLDLFLNRLQSNAVAES